MLTVAKSLLTTRLTEYWSQTLTGQGTESYSSPTPSFYKWRNRGPKRVKFLPDKRGKTLAVHYRRLRVQFPHPIKSCWLAGLAQWVRGREVPEEVDKIRDISSQTASGLWEHRCTPILWEEKFMHFSCRLDLLVKLKQWLVNPWEELTCHSTGAWINKPWPVPTMEQYSAKKKKKKEQTSDPCNNAEESHQHAEQRSQVQKRIFCQSLFIERSKADITHC